MRSKIPLVDVSKHFQEDGVHPLYTSREKIYVRKITGFFQRIRKASLSILLFMYFAFAWINIDGQQLILFDIAERKFHLFGAVFWPQDFTLLAFALIICAFGLFFVTSLFGRVWCGYSCPQTVWSFMFIWLEEFFEGSRNQRIKLDRAPSSISKAAKKSAKHLSWVALSLATAITFVGYFYPIRELSSDLISFSLTSGWAWFWIFFFTAATYINAGWLREQVCIYMCPYARFQSVMFNENTMIVGYDKERGEPRGSRARDQDHSLGSCVDCQVCVQVCPVGIDIRDGLQYECIGCALCIDACDSIMNKMNYPTGLIRYASETEFQQGKVARKFDLRAIGYGLVLLTAVSVFMGLMVNRPQTELSALRDRGTLYNESGLGMIENTYLLKLINKGESGDIYKLKVSGQFPIQVSTSMLEIGPGEIKTFPVTVEAKPESINQSNSDIVFTIQSSLAPETKASADSTFLGPKYD